MFGEQRLKAVLDRCAPEEDPKGIISRISMAVKDFSVKKGAVQTDDITMLCVRALCRKEGNERYMLEKQVPAGMEYMDGVLEALREYLEEVNCPKKTALHLEIALEELFTNIASYAYGGEPGPVRVYCGLEGGELVLEVEDKGISFNPLDREAPDLQLPLEERPVGGLGIYMVRQFADSVEYQYRDGCNILRLKICIRP